VRGQRLTADDLEMKPAPARLGAIGDLDLAVGRRLRAAVQPGQPVLERHLDPAYDLNEGEEITLYLSQGAIEITLTARALENGWIGDRISVQPSNSERLVQAQVIAPGQARIRPNMLPPSAVMDPR
jgi:flagella basal body P-ring formation protein FlgA